MVPSLFPRLLAAAFAVLTFGAPASAQNYDGQGLLKFGIFNGGTWMDVRSKNPSQRDANLDGATFGMSAGYDYVFNRRLLLGIEGDVSIGDISGDLNGQWPMHLQWMSTLRGRLGVFLTPQFMIYGTAGAAWAGLDIKRVTPVTTLTGTTFLNASKAVAGYSVGGGLEYDIGTRWGIIAFAEYLHTGFGAWTKVPGQGFDLDADADIFRVGFKFKIGHDHRWGQFYDAGYEPLK